MRAHPSAIISKNLRIRSPESFEAHEYSIVDDFCYISTQVSLGRFSHIAASCTLGGGSQFKISIGSFSSLSSGVRIYCSSNDFTNDLVVCLPQKFESLIESPLRGDVILEDYTGVGANSLIMPNNRIPEGTVIGALSVVPYNFQLEPWSVYAGSPCKKVGQRNRDRVLKQVQEIESRLKGK